MPTTNHRNLPVPPGGVADEWSGPHTLYPDEAVYVRFITWSKHDTDKVGVAVDGAQYSDGRIERAISLYDAEALSAAEARALSHRSRLPASAEGACRCQQYDPMGSTAQSSELRLAPWVI